MYDKSTFRQVLLSTIKDVLKGQGYSPQAFSSLTEDLSAVLEKLRQYAPISSKQLLDGQVAVILNDPNIAHNNREYNGCIVQRRDDDLIMLSPKEDSWSGHFHSKDRIFTVLPLNGTVFL